MINSEISQNRQELLVNIAIKRGYSHSESVKLASKVEDLIRQGKYPEAYEKYISRLCS